MQHWFSNLTKDATPQGQIVFRIALLFIFSGLFSAPLNIYAYTQTGAWQIVASLIGLAILCIVSGYAAYVALHNNHQRASIILIGIACFFITFVSILITGLGVILGLSLFLINIAIINQTLEGQRSFIVIITVLFFSVLTIFIDLFASWGRISVPVLTNSQTPLSKLKPLFLQSATTINK